MNVSGFRYTNTNIQVGRFVGGTEAIYNGARARILGRGPRRRAGARPRTIADGRVSYLHARFTFFPNADFIMPIPGFPPNLSAVVPGSAKGKTLPFSPTLTGNAGVAYRVQTRIGTFAANATYFHTSRLFAAVDNVAFQLPYDLVNASVTWTDRTGTLSLKAWGENLGITIFVTSLVEANQGLIDSIGSPRTDG